MNEHVVRMKLLSRGFKTREIGMIISLAAQIQEKDLKFSDKTMPLDKKNKVAISSDALDRAVDRFRGAKLAVSGSSNSNLKSKLQLRSLSEWVNIAKISLVIGAVLIVIFGTVFISENPKNEESFDLASIDKAKLSNPQKGSSYRFKLQRINTVSGEVYLDSEEIHKVINTNNSGYKVEKSDSNGVVLGYYESPMNQFMGPSEVKDLSGKLQTAVFSGNYNSIFPLTVGNKMEYTHRTN